MDSHKVEEKRERDIPETVDIAGYIKFRNRLKYYSLKEETRSVEALRRGAENLMREETQHTRARGMEL
jgi:hypothetical protein